MHNRSYLRCHRIVLVLACIAGISSGATASLSLGGSVELDNCQKVSQTDLGSPTVSESKDGPADHREHPEREEDAVLVNGYKLVLITIGLFFSTAYLLTTHAVTLPFSRLKTFFPMNYINMVAGLGGGGPFFGSLIVITHSGPLRQRTAFSGYLVSVLSVANLITEPVAPISLRENVVRLDPLGTAIFLPAMVCLLLGLQWGGTQCPWLNARMGPRATVPPRLHRDRNIRVSALYGVCRIGVMFIFFYYLPTLLQVVQGVPATKPGFQNLPLIISNLILAIICVVLYRRWAALDTAVRFRGRSVDCIPGGSEDGIGMGFQLLVFVLLHGCTFVFVAQDIFRNRLSAGIHTALPMLDPRAVNNVGPTSLQRVYSSDTPSSVDIMNNYVVVHTFHPAIGLSDASFFAATVV
ncbi:hypothetical protein BO79DRAFT_229239 [Aspergillus costaricaensis CBS 115574]|uniref:Uncharacterized protein n=1 Tax=Aspergillus costaricaensis CBS 115574 TaxID=1448317 RepID=A0ACD1IBX6_9EURO|nr:hypothetical protein BO79DRAFT_229239 [Aspergillus costaricaensis CBS 115574]RAK87740.1 hypothetical protein BO79DRAFT_229239 [Aspergillus costaricaensis CBS 115574]